jgi:RNA polymerase sigma factor (sigma-70 family)
LAAATRRDDARDRLVLGHDALALAVAGRYRRRGVDADDLAQEARLGLLIACERFDPARGVRFATFAPWWVRRMLQGAVRRQAIAARLNRHGVERGRVEARDTSALRAGLPEEAERVRACLRGLPAAEGAVLRLRYGLDGCAPRTRRAIARQFGLEADAVARIERKAKARLKALLEERQCREID